jgi:hypothetical protein
MNRAFLPVGWPVWWSLFRIKLCRYGVISPFHVYLSSEVLIYYPGFHSPAPRVRTNENYHPYPGSATFGQRRYYGVKCSDGGENQMINEAI